MVVLGLRFCVRAFSSYGKRGPLLIAVRGPLTIAASLVVQHRLQTRRLSTCGSRAQPLCGMWDPPRPGLEPVSPALAGRFSTTAPLLFFKVKCLDVVPLLYKLISSASFFPFYRKLNPRKLSNFPRSHKLGSRWTPKSPQFSL